MRLEECFMENNTKKKNCFKDLRTYLVIILIITMATFIILLGNFNVIPMKYLIPGCVVAGVICAGLIWLIYSKKINKVNHILGDILIIFLCFVTIMGSVYLVQTNTAIDKITVAEGDKEYEIISVVVKKETAAEALADVKNATFAIPEKIDAEHTKATIKNINQQLDAQIKTAAYVNTNEQAKALMEREVEAMILNEAYRSLLDENYPSFAEDTKIVYTFKIEKESKQLGSKVDVNKDPYHVYISGIDTYGPISAKSRSDVNMIATINPTTHEILLTSIPRDYYITQTCQADQQDKLTHSGIFGVDCTVESMQDFTGLIFNYYVRVNFSSLEGIVNAIGGIDVYNPMAFYSGVDSSFIPAGNLHMNGNTALKFARERHAYKDGDRQRGRNQMIVLSAIIDRSISPAIITGYSGIMETVGETIQTNMTKEEMTSIIKNQLENGGNWNIIQQSVTGDGGTDWSPANGFNAYVMYPNQESVDTALTNIQTIVDGGTVEIAS